MLNLILAFFLLLMSTTVPISPKSNTDNKVEKIVEQVKEENENEELTEEQVIHEMLKKEYEANNQYDDVAGVLYMKDYIFDVVMRPIEEDPERYLHKSREGKYLREGELFFSADTKHDDNNIDLNMARIYGHNMATGRKFGLLKRLLNVNNKRDLYYFDGENTIKFRPSRSFKFIDGSEVLERHDLIGDERVDFLKNVAQPYQAEFESLNNAKEDDDILILQTCESAWGLRRDVVIFIEDGVVN